MEDECPYRSGGHGLCRLGEDNNGQLQTGYYLVLSDCIGLTSALLSILFVVSADRESGFMGAVSTGKSLSRSIVSTFTVSVV